MITSPYQLREAIFHILVDTYDRNNVRNWHSQNAHTLCKDTTNTILAEVALAYTMGGERGEYEIRRLFNSIHNTIWTNFPGGTTAFGAAARIAPLLNIEAPDFKDY